MDIRKEVAQLKGADIELLPDISSDSYDEICDDARIVTKPLVSVHMMTYNHEKYIRQAVESVIAQKCPFEYEIVIGEDCSTDSTRSICLELQRKYPENIRLLLSRKNVGIGVNTRRLFLACRGEYVAYLEGDDYWIDERKLSKQVTAYLDHPDITFLFSGATIYRPDLDETVYFDEQKVWGETPCVIPGKKFFLWTMFGKDPFRQPGAEFFAMTSGFMFRRRDILAAMDKFECFSWSMSLYDSMIVLSLSSMGNVYYLPDRVSVYRQLNSGLTRVSGSSCSRDTWLIRMYFLRAQLGLDFQDISDVTVLGIVYVFLRRIENTFGIEGVRKWIDEAKQNHARWRLIGRCSFYFKRRVWMVERAGARLCNCDRIWTTYFTGIRVPSRMFKLYKDVGAFVGERRVIREPIWGVLARKLKRIVK